MRKRLFCHIISVIAVSNYCYSSDLIFHYQTEIQLNQEDSERLFESDKLLQLTVLSDFSSIMDDRGENRSYHKGLLYYIYGQRDTIERKIKLKTRGNFRRDPANCKYPPIMIKFGKLKSADSIFKDQSKLKLVTQCQLENYVLLEYLAYRIYNQFTDFSYRVRLAHITYVDMETRQAYFTRYAFFIESEMEMAERLNAVTHKSNVVQYYLDRGNAITMAMFQYMIGNNDWYATSKHNTSILKLNKTGKLIAIPFDFDWSKLVNANYTKPEDVPESFLKERRVYKGLCLESEEFEKYQQLFNSKKELTIGLVKALIDLPQQRKHESLRYIDRFYKILNKSSSLPKIFQKEECIKEPGFQGK